MSGNATLTVRTLSAKRSGDLRRFTRAGNALFFAGACFGILFYLIPMLVHDPATDGGGRLHEFLHFRMAIIIILWLFSSFCPAYYYFEHPERFRYWIGSLSVTVSFSCLSFVVCRMVALTLGVRGSVYGPCLISLYGIALFIPHGRIQKILFFSVLLTCTILFLLSESPHILLDCIAIALSFLANIIALKAKSIINYKQKRA